MERPTNRDNGFRLDKTAFEVVDLEQADPGVDHEWIARSTPAERMRALELLRWNTYGYERATSRLQRVLEFAQQETR